MSTPDQTLQALLANLRPRSQASNTNLDHPAEPPRDLSVSISSASALANTPPPPFSPVPSTSTAGPSGATAQNLLNLLNFGGTSAESTAAQPVRSTTSSTIHTHATKPSQENTFTAADLLHRATTSTSSRGPSALDSRFPARLQESQPQDHTRESPITPSAIPQPTGTMPGDIGSDAGQLQAATPNAGAPKPMFTYKNPFEALRASRPHTPQRDHQPAAEQYPQEEAPVQSVEDPSLQQVLNSAMPDRVKLTPKSRTSERQTTPAQQTPLTTEMQSSNPEVLEVDQMEQEAAHTTTTGAGQINTTAADDDAKPPPQIPDTGGSPGRTGLSQRVVPILTFPVKAFVSLTLQLHSLPTTRVREDGVMEISRLKKDFDQTDRSLAAASSKYITYALVKNGGMRIIRQHDGTDRQIFKHTHDRIFNVSVCTSSFLLPPSEHQSVLGTGVSGAVYYATLSKQGHDFFATGELDQESLVFPAYPQADENTAGGVLKTRAKRSSQHPQYFAIGRGKAINIVWPSTLVQKSAFVDSVAGQNRVNTEKLFHERPLQILTGKAGKDFTFSEDDTTIVSLDKTGRLRFWDIRKLTDEENARSVQITPYVVDTPILSLATASPSERSWPTSVHFIDKARPYMKGGALRYVLVGLRQNHTLQLWDIALGKAVQEINFPHESETDAICSVTYHPPSGIIVVGHPTRNSIFFIHLSAPRYVLSSSLSQASFVQRVAAKDAEIPKPESTACMSGIREVSFVGRGQLRSIELLPLYKQGEPAQADPGEPLFELYVAHSTGVTCLVINKEDMGWDAENKAVKSVNAEREGLITLKDLKLGSVIENDVRSKSPAQEHALTKQEKKKKTKKSKDNSDEATNGIHDSQPELPKALESPRPEMNSTETVAAEQGVSKESKKSKKKKEPVTENQAMHNSEMSKVQNSSLAPDQDNAAASRRTASPKLQQQTEALSMSISGDWLDKEMRKLEKTVKTEFKNELDQLYQNIKTDRASQDQASASRQEAILRVVSATLNTNVEKTLGSILHRQMQETLVPSLVNAMSTELSHQIVQTVNQSVRKELGSELPVHLNRTLQSPQMLTRITNDVSDRISSVLEQEVRRSVSNTVSIGMSSVATSTATELVNASEARMAEQISHLSRQHAARDEKMELLNRTLQSITSTLQSMMEAQTQFQSQVIRDVRQPRIQDPAQRAIDASSPVPSTQPVPARRSLTKSDLEIAEVRELMEQRKYEEGSIKWLQSSQPVKLFDDLFVRFTPDYLATDVSPLVAFSIGVTVANSLSTNTQRRLEWISAAFDTVDFKDREILELKNHAPTLIGTLIQKLDALYHQRIQTNPNDVVVAMLPPLLKTARDLINAFESVGSSYTDRSGRKEIV